MNDKQRTAILFIACLLAVFLFSTNSFASQQSPINISTGIDIDSINKNTVIVSLSVSCYLPFKDGTVVLKVPSIGTNSEYTAVLWSGESDSDYNDNFEKTFADLPKGSYKFVAEFNAYAYDYGFNTYRNEEIYVEVGDSDTTWSYAPFSQKERDRLLMELKKRGIERNDRDVWAQIKTLDLPYDLKERIGQSFASPKLQDPVEISIGIDDASSNKNTVLIYIYASTPEPFHSGTIIFKVLPPDAIRIDMDVNPENTTILWNGGFSSEFYIKLEKIIAYLPKGRHLFVAEFKTDPYNGSHYYSKRESLYVEVGDSDMAWSNVSFWQIKLDRLLMEMRKRGIEVKKGEFIDTKTLPDDLRRRFDELHGVKSINVDDANNSNADEAHQKRGADDSK